MLNFILTNFQPHGAIFYCNKSLPTTNSILHSPTATKMPSNSSRSRKRKHEDMSAGSVSGASVQTKSLSKVSIVTGQKLLDVNFKNLLEAGLPVAELITLYPLPAGLKERIYDDLILHIRLCKYPNGLQDENLKSFIFYSIVKQVNTTLMNIYQLNDSHLCLDTQVEFECTLKGQKLNGKSDFSVFRAVAEPNQSFYYSVECKKRDLVEAFFKCGVCVKRQYEFEPQKKVILSLIFFQVIWIDLNRIDLNRSESIFEFKFHISSSTHLPSLFPRSLSSAIMASALMATPGS